MTTRTERSIPASTRAQGAITSAATLVSIVVLGCVLAYWTWVWLAPQPEPRVPASETAGTGTGASMLFGAVQRDRTVAAPTGVAMKLLGVAAGSSHTRGYAVLQVGGKDIVAIREGGDIVTGISLAEVHRDRIVLTRNGVRETLAWPGQSGSAAPLIPKQNVAAGVAPGSTVAASSQLPASVVVGPAPTKAERDRLSD